MEKLTNGALVMPKPSISNFTVQETEAAINYFKNNKSPGCDNIPAEFIKFCKEILSDDPTTIYIYIIEPLGWYKERGEELSRNNYPLYICKKYLKFWYTTDWSFQMKPSAK